MIIEKITIYHVGPYSTRQDWHHLDNGYIVEVNTYITYLLTKDIKNDNDSYTKTYCNGPPIYRMSKPMWKKVLFKSRREALARIKSKFKICRDLRTETVYEDFFVVKDLSKDNK